MSTETGEELTLSDYSQDVLQSSALSLEARNRLVEWSIGLVGAFLAASWITPATPLVVRFVLSSFALAVYCSFLKLAIGNQSRIRRLGFIQTHLHDFQFRANDEAEGVAYDHFKSIVRPVELGNQRVETWTGLIGDVLALGLLPLGVVTIGSYLVSTWLLAASYLPGQPYTSALCLVLAAAAPFGWGVWVVNKRPGPLYVPAKGSTCPRCKALRNDLRKSHLRLLGEPDRKAILENLRSD